MLNRKVFIRIISVLLCIAAVVALRVTDDESRRVFHYLRNYSREWTLLNNVTWGSSIMFSAVGACLHIVAASVMVHKWRRMTGSYIDYQSNNAVYSSKQYNDMLISGAVFTFINAIIFAADVLITMRLT